MSKGLMLHSGTESVPFSGAETVATLSLTVSKSMFPLMTFVAYHVDLKGQVTSGSLQVPVDINPQVIDVSIKVSLLAVLVLDLFCFET